MRRAVHPRYLYDCPQILIVNKPAGVAVDGPEDDTLLNRALLYLCLLYTSSTPACWKASL